MPQSEDVRFLMLVCICVSSIVTSYFDRFVNLHNINNLQLKTPSSHSSFQQFDIKNFEEMLARNYRQPQNNSLANNYIRDAKTYVAQDDTQLNSTKE